MTPANLQNALIARIKDILKDFPLKTTYNDPKPFNIFKQKLPEKMLSEYDYSDEENSKDLYPYCVVKLASGIKEDNYSTQENNIQLILCVKNEDMEGTGFDDVLACMEAILGNLNLNPIVDKRYSLKYPVKWATVDEDTHPYYYIGIELNFETNTLKQVH